MLLTYRQRMQRDNPGMTFLPGHPIYELAYYIFAEEREAIGRPGKFKLCSTKHHGLELWKARYLGTRGPADPFYIPENSLGRVEFLEYFPAEAGLSFTIRQRVPGFAHLQEVVHRNNSPAISSDLAEKGISYDKIQKNPQAPLIA